MPCIQIPGNPTLSLQYFILPGEWKFKNAKDAWSEEAGYLQGVRYMSYWSAVYSSADLYQFIRHTLIERGFLDEA